MELSADQTRKPFLHGFVNFIRAQGIVGLAIGFIMGGAVSKTVSSFVDNIINPIIGIFLGKVNLADKVIAIGATTIMWGAFVTSLIDLMVVAAVVYFIFRGLEIQSLDKKE